MSWSLRRRLVGIVLVVSTTLILVMALALYIGVRRAAWRQHDEALVSRARALAAIAEYEGGGYEMVLPPQPIDEMPAYVEVWRPDGSVLLRSASLARADLTNRFASNEGASLQDIALPDGREGRAVALRFFARGSHDPAQRLLLVLAEGTGPVDDALASLRTVFVVVVLAALALSALAAAWLLSRVMRPVSQLSAQIEQIDDRAFTRVSAKGLPTELAPPVRKLNQVLERLEASFNRERELTADVSHELRTPLAALRTLLEVTALGDRTTPEYKSALADALLVVKQLTALVENLLALTRLDNDDSALAPERFDLSSLVGECWAMHSQTAASRGLEFRNQVRSGTTVRTDREKLRIVIGNLLSNAAEYTEGGGWIEVTNEDCVLSVTDSGPPLSKEELQRVFDRFWRRDDSRTGSGAHCGIGLSLSRSLCERLAMSLVAQTSETGHVTFRIDEDQHLGH